MSRGAEFETAFREAVATGAYNDAGTLLHRYLESTNEPEEFTRAQALITWATFTARVVRAHHAAALEQIDQARRYFGPPVPAKPTCELRG